MMIRRNDEAVPIDAFHAIVDAYAQTLGHIGENKTVYFHSVESEADHCVAKFSYNYPELPVIRDGELAGWQPPYMTVEKFDEALREHLPDGYSYEHATSDTHVVYREF